MYALLIFLYIYGIWRIRAWNKHKHTGDYTIPAYFVFIAPLIAINELAYFSFEFIVDSFKKAKIEQKFYTLCEKFKLCKKIVKFLEAR